MITEQQEQTAHEWAVEQFDGAELSDVRRVERAITIAEAMAASPGAPLPQLFAHPYDLKAAYRFLRHPEATPDHLQAGHRERVGLELEKPGRYLLVEDTSEILCASTQEIEGLGPVGGSKAGKIGFHLHSVLAVRWPRVPDTPAPRRPGVEILGLADQQYHVRQPRPAETARTGSERRVRAAAELESALWERASQRLGPAPEREDVQWVKVCDRAGDIYDHLCHCQAQRQRFVIRATQDRVLVTAEGQRAGKLFATARGSASLGVVALEVRARPGQTARTARLQVSVTPLLVRAPQVARQGPGTRPPAACTVVRLWEVSPPAGTKPLEWLLLTDLPAQTFAQACEIAQIYATRWLDEEFHKALKTGMGVERLQLTTAQEWFAATALLSVAALRLIELRERVRHIPDAPAAAAGLSDLEVAVLRARSGKPLLTVREVALALGRLGGHLNRKGDGLPGWITLWRGWQILQTLVDGVLLARKLTQFG
jgi:Transposase DNA-binding/Transposase Tn5 dimerisation domain